MELKQTIIPLYKDNLEPRIHVLTQSVQSQLGAAFLQENGTNLYLFHRVGVTEVIYKAGSA